MPIQKAFEAEEQRIAWTSVFAMSLIVAMGCLVAIIEDLLRGHWFATVDSVRALAVLISFTSIGLLLAFREKVSRQQMNRLFLLVLLPVFPMTWLAQANRVALAHPWTPFVAYKIAFFVLAVCVPGNFWINGALMVAFVGEAIFFWFRFHLAENAWLIATGEPFYTFVYAIAGGILLWFRFQHRETTRLLAASQAKAGFLEKAAKMFLTIRDKANSPIQSLQLSVELLKENGSSSDNSIAQYMEQSLDQLKSLNQIYSELKRHTVWDGTELFDPQEFIRTLKGN